MTKLEKVIAILVVIGLVVSMGFLLVPKTVDKSLGDSVSLNYIRSMVSTSVAVGPQSTTLLAPSSGRVYAIFGNTGTSTQIVYLSLNGGAATTSSGIIIPSGSSYTINFNNLYIGGVTAISSSGTSTVTETYSQ